MTDTLYHNTSKAVDKWLEVHVGETFDLDLICRQLDAKTREDRQYIAIKLAYEVKQGKLEKTNRLYKVINSTLDVIDIENLPDLEEVPFHWPKGMDGSCFPFEGHLTVRPKDLIVIAGVSNMGKSAICKNILVENMDDWAGRCTMMVNEYQPVRFRNGMQLFCKDLKDDAGKMKFQLAKRDADWQYAVQPDHLNIIDWIGMDTDFYKIGTVLKAIIEKLHNGIAVVVIQKGEGKELGTGGQFSEHYASYYLSIDFGRIFFKKAKDYNGYNPNGRMYGFDISSGVLLSKIQEVRKCGQCAGTGERFDRNAGGKVSCLGCSGKGWL